MVCTGYPPVIKPDTVSLLYDALVVEELGLYCLCGSRDPLEVLHRLSEYLYLAALRATSLLGPVCSELLQRRATCFLAIQASKA